jgi:exonuclease 3'-5' domain-containing protein 1
MVEFRLCNTVDHLQVAIRALSPASTVYFDCEGDELGQAGGSLAIMSLGVIEKEQGEEHLSIFLIDVLAFQGKGRSIYLNPIFDILESESIVKVVFDGRMDSSELLHGYNVTLRRVIDLQLADVTSREKRGETRLQRLERLRSVLPKREVEENASLLRQVQKLNGLIPALLEHGVKVGPKISKYCSPFSQFICSCTNPTYAVI